MIAVTIDEAWPISCDPFTVADLDRMPSDGHRYELVDGVLVVSPQANDGASVRRDATRHRTGQSMSGGALRAGGAGRPARQDDWACP